MASRIKMASRNETIKTIKDNLKKLFATVNHKFGDFVLTDGSKITTPAEDLEVGAEVYAIDELGNQTPLDDGDYVLSDGRTISVQGNAVTNVSADASTEDETPMSSASGDAPVVTAGTAKGQKTGQETAMSDGMPDAASDESSLAQRVTDLESTLEEILNLVKTLSQSQATTTQTMMSKINKFGAEPGAEPIKLIKKGYEVFDSKKISKKANMDEIIEIRKMIAEKNKRDNNLS